MPLTTVNCPVRPPQPMSPAPASTNVLEDAAARSSGRVHMSVWEVLAVVTTFRTNVERLMMYRATVSMLRFLSVLNFTYTLVGVTSLVLALCPEWSTNLSKEQQFHLLKLGTFVTVFAPVAFMVDIVALRGLRLWSRYFLIPWLVVYGLIVAMVVSIILSGIFRSGFHWQYLLLAMCTFCFLSAWRHVRLQFSSMILERPISTSPDCLNLNASTPATRPPSDLPPKYEDLEQPPPYDMSKPKETF